MPPKPLLTKKKNNCRKYLELHIDGSGRVDFYNLSRSTLSVVKKISGKSQDQQSFYCG
jgi:hypothetical protein